MFFGKKEDKKTLPDLPSSGDSFSFGNLPKKAVNEESHSENQEEDSGEHPLPSFPDSPGHNKFSQAAIKDAVNSNEQAEEESEFVAEFPEEPSKHGKNVVEMEEWTPSSKFEHEEERVMPERYERSEEKRVMPEKYEQYEEAPVRVSFASRTGKKEADVFVKLDKFYSAKRSLNEIKDHMEEVENLIKKIRETKFHEEQELAAWEKDLMQIKTRLKDVTENIFEKVK